MSLIDDLSWVELKRRLQQRGITSEEGLSAARTMHECGCGGCSLALAEVMNRGELDE